MSGDSVCDAPGPIGSGALVGGRPTRARCAYHACHNGPCSWDVPGSFQYERLRRAYEDGDVTEPDTPP